MDIGHTRRIRGVTVPSIMYGTAWKEERTQALTFEAIKCGFRAIDTANQRKHYDEASVGAAVAAAVGSGSILREALFIQTKFSFQRAHDHRLPYDPKADIATQVRQSLDSSFGHLGVRRIDSYLLHFPASSDGVGDADWQSWRAMEMAVQDGEVALLGVSNVSRKQLAMFMDGAKVAPAFVQNRCYARDRWDADIRAFCAEHDIVYQGFSLLTANRQALSLPQVETIAHRYGKSIPQVVFRFAIQLAILPLTGTTDTAHMRQDLDIFDFSLSDEELGVMLELGAL